MACVRSSTITFCACISLGLTTAANAALVDRGGGLIYDTDLNITWLSDANYGAGSIYDNGFLTTDGAMTWQNAVNWAADLSYDDSVRGVTYTDWRLPKTLQPDAGCSQQEPPRSPSFSAGTNCTGSELGHLYYSELGGTISADPFNPATIANSSDADLAKFTNIKSDGYWSGREFDATFAFVLNFGYNGAQGADQKTLGYYGWAVRDGDVSAVPAPGAAWLLGTGLAGLGGRRWLRRRTSV